MTRSRDVLQSLLRRAGALALAVVIAGVALPAARADEFTDKANGALPTFPDNRRSDAILLPLLAKMAPPPRAVSSRDKAELLPTGAAGWSEAEQWALAQPQRAVIDAIRSVTQETDYRKAYGFGQKYGVEGVPVELVKARLYTELGDPQTLSAAQHLYLPKFDEAAVLVNIEATRLLHDGKPQDAIDVLTNWLYFCRSICDRAFFKEVRWGLANMGFTYERIRDVAYVDMRNESRQPLDLPRLLKQIQRLASTESYLDLERIRFPIADHAGTEQVVARVYLPRAGVNDAVFASTMSRLGSTDHPLRLFSEEARWRNAAALQGSTFDANELVKGIYGDWLSVWQVAQFDARMSQVRAFDKFDKTKFALIAQSTPNMFELFDLRQLARTEAVGTRTSLAHLAFFYDPTTRSFARVVSAVRPKWLPELEADPFNPQRASGGKPPLSYTVPMRDTPKNQRGEAVPYEIDIVPRDGSAAIGLKLKDDTFLLHSWGSDFANNHAKRIQNTVQRVQGADYLLWPPLLSLKRQYLIDLGELK